MADKEVLDRFGKLTEEITRLKELDESRFLEPIGEGKWSVREMIGHFLYWDKFIIEKHVPFMNQGAVLLPFPDHDEYNSEAIAYIRVFETTSSLIDEFVEQRKQVIERMTGIERDVRFTIGSGNRPFTVETYLEIFIDHDNHHLHQIKARLN